MADGTWFRGRWPRSQSRKPKGNISVIVVEQNSNSKINNKKKKKLFIHVLLSFSLPQKSYKNKIEKQKKKQECRKCQGSKAVNGSQRKKKKRDTEDRK